MTKENENLALLDELLLIIMHLSRLFQEVLLRS